MSDFYDFDNEKIQDNSRTDFNDSVSDKEILGTDTGKQVMSDHLDMIDFEKEIQREPDIERRSMREVQDPDYYPVSGDGDYRSGRCLSEREGLPDHDQPPGRGCGTGALEKQFGRRLITGRWRNVLLINSKGRNDPPPARKGLLHRF